MPFGAFSRSDRATCAALEAMPRAAHQRAGQGRYWISPQYRARTN
jgi:hypothetical protein